MKFKASTNVFLQLVFSVIGCAAMYFIAKYIFNSTTGATVAAGVLGLFLLGAIIYSFAPYRVLEGGDVKRGPVKYPLEDLVYVKGRTRTTPLATGLGSSVIDLIYEDQTLPNEERVQKYVTITDTRNVFTPLKSGYDAGSVEAVTYLLGKVLSEHEDSENIPHETVRHFIEMMKIK